MAQGRALNQELLSELQGVDELDDLIRAFPRFQGLFGRLVDVMIDAKKWQTAHKISWNPTEEDHQLSLELAYELERLYQIPAARALLEKSQEVALLRLDALNKN